MDLNFQYLLIAYDYKDDEAINRRLVARAKHIELGNKLVMEGKLIFGVAILDDSGKMIGSSFVCNFASRKEIDDWLKIEPYVVNKVWEKIEIRPCKVGPSFVNKLK